MDCYSSAIILPSIFSQQLCIVVLKSNPKSNVFSNTRSCAVSYRRIEMKTAFFVDKPYANMHS